MQMHHKLLTERRTLHQKQDVSNMQVVIFATKKH